MAGKSNGSELCHSGYYLASFVDISLWILLGLANMTAGVCTSMIVFLCAMMVAAIAFWMMIAEKKFSVLVKAGVVCIPNLVYMLLYLFLSI